MRFWRLNWIKWINWPVCPGCQQSCTGSYLGRILCFRCNTSGRR